MTDERYNEILELEQKQLRKKYSIASQTSYQVLASKTQGINESTTGSENNDTDRKGNSFKFKLNRPITESLKWEAGFRYDSDLLTLANPSVEVESQRYMLIAGLVYKMDRLWGINTTPYLGLGIGIGKSQSQINDSVQSGSATVLPSLTLGLEFEMNDTTGLLVELSVEALNTSESFSDGVEQTTNITSAMLSIGLEFE